jgi:benzoylformate decarboxylase
MNMDAQMAGDLVAMMEPVTKYSTMVLDSRSLLRTLRRAIKIAATPPMGPVYICLPMNLLDEPNDEEVFPSCIPSTRSAPTDDVLLQTAELMLGASRPRIYIGDGVGYSEATEELTKVAELAGAEVYGVDVGDLNMDTSHPCYMGTTGHMFGYHSKPILQEGDVNLVVGTYMVPEVFPELGDIFAANAKIIHFDLNAYEIAKNHRVDIGVVCDPKTALGRLVEVLEQRMSEAQLNASAKRVMALGDAKTKALQAERDSDNKIPLKAPLHMAAFMKVLAEKVPEDVIVFDEALTNFPALVRYLPPKVPGHYFVTRGGSLGVGIPGALGAKVANPDKTVIGFTGDGGSMYTIQALWSAARHKTGAKFVICNNGSYRLLQMNVDAYWTEREIAGHDHPLCFDLSEPRIDFAAIAAAMGVKGVRVTNPEDIAPAIDRMLEDDEPFLIDLMLEGDFHPELIGVKCGQ